MLTMATVRTMIKCVECCKPACDFDLIYHSQICLSKLIGQLLEDQWNIILWLEICGNESPVNNIANLMCVTVTQWRIKQSSLLLPAVRLCAGCRHRTSSGLVAYLWSDHSWASRNSADRLCYICAACRERNGSWSLWCIHHRTYWRVCPGKIWFYCF